MRRWHSRRGYVEMATEDMEALELIYSTTKPCPRCTVRIEKNQGVVRVRAVRAWCALSDLDCIVRPPPLPVPQQDART